VVDILDMWSFIEHAYEELSDEQRTTLERDAEPFGDNPKFQGFDGNNESEHMSTAMFLVNDLDRFDQFKGRSFNCHHSSLNTHRRMLAAFEPIRRQLTIGRLTVEQLVQILKP
jgi:uncharacterized protein YfbU (UPF0304 family)